MNQDRPLLYIIPQLWKHKILIVSVAILAGILSALVMFSKPDYYQSISLFYPVNSALLGPVIDLRDQIQVYGNDKDVDRLLSIANSQELERFIFEEFDLADHYGMSANTPLSKSKVFKKFRKLYSVHKTEFDAIKVSVEDTDPAKAKDLVAAIVKYIDMHAVQIIKSSQAATLKSLTDDLNQKKSKLGDLTESIKSLRQQYRIYDSQTQAEALATLEIKNPNNSGVRKMIADYNAGIDDLMKLEVSVREMNKAVVFQGIEINKVQTSYDKQSPGLHVIEEAIMPLEKSRPRRSLYILGAMLFMSAITVLYILIKEQIQQLDFELN